MLDLTFPLYQLLIAAFVLGYFTHAFVFARAIWSGNSLYIISLAGILIWPLSAFAFATNARDPVILTWLEALVRAASLALVYLSGFTFSIATYRLIHHRLRDFPGPKLASLSGWYWTYRYARRLHMYDELMALHAEYGDFVRIGRRTFRSRTMPA
jgi:hypothetical protein